MVLYYWVKFSNEPFPVKFKAERLDEFFNTLAQLSIQRGVIEFINLDRIGH